MLQYMRECSLCTSGLTGRNTNTSDALSMRRSNHIETLAGDKGFEAAKEEDHADCHKDGNTAPDDIDDLFGLVVKEKTHTP